MPLDEISSTVQFEIDAGAKVVFLYPYTANIAPQTAPSITMSELPV